MARSGLPRARWDGEPKPLGETCRLQKGTRTATCQLWSHPLGWELRLVAAGELVQSAACRSQDEVVTLTEQWKAKLLQNGWNP